MKEELIQLRDLTNEYAEAKKAFETRKATFNEDTKETMVILSRTVTAANYDTVCQFYDEYTKLNEYAQKLKKEHPRYGEKRVKATLLEMFKATEEYQDRSLCAEQIVDAYLKFDQCGFYEVKTLEQKANSIGLQLAEKVDTVKTDKIDTAMESINKAVETVKPYGEQAKKQLNVFGNIAKDTLNKGAKRLIKILEESDDKKDE